jgi:outer membrane cobalamin receptor
MPSAGLRLFYNAVADLIDRRFDVFANVKQATTAGMELWTSWSPMGGLDLQGSYTYLYARDDTEHRPLDYRSPHSVGLGAVARAPWGSEAAVFAFYRSGQRSFFFDTIENQWQKDRLPGYWLVNGLVRHRFVIGGDVAASGFLRMRNILDTNYVQGSFAPEPGRQVFAGLEVEF